MADKERNGWQYKLGCEVKANGVAGEIDYLGWNAGGPEQVLLIEYKATLDVDEIHEVDSATREMIKGQKQLQKCMKILNSLSPREKSALYPFVPWDTVEQMYGIVVSSGCEPNDKYDQSEIPGISLGAFQSRVPSQDFVCPRRLWEACRKREWLSHLDILINTEMEMRVGDQTYYVPASSPGNND